MRVSTLGRGLVQDQDARIGQRRAGDGEQLALALADSPLPRSPSIVS